MKERPIIFDAESVRAILDGRKTQTRRAITRWKITGIDNGYPEGVVVVNETTHNLETVPWTAATIKHYLRCPYGVPGDGLWVKEVCRYWFPITDDGQPVDGWHVRYRADGYERICQNTTWDEGDQYVTPHDVGLDVEPNRWRSPIFMHRFASRIDLGVTGMRAERLQDISEEDAEAEGVLPILVPPDGGSCPHIEGFIARWDAINAKRGYSWESNPWVWVVDFERVADG